MSCYTQEPIFDPALHPLPVDRRCYVNRKVSIEKLEGGLAVVRILGTPWHRFAFDSELDRRVVAANLVLANLAATVDVTRAFEVSRTTLFRDRQRLLEGGLPLLAQVRRGPKGATKCTPQIVTRARALFREGLSKRAIARRLGVSEFSVRVILRDQPAASVETQNTLPLSPPVTTPLPAPEPTQPQEAAAPVAAQIATHPPTVDEPRATGSAESVELLDAAGFPALEPHPELTDERDLDRSLERVFARFGLITEASVRFVPGDGLRFAGALLLVAAVVGTGFFRAVQKVYGRLRNGFYGLRHTILTLVLMKALRIQRAQHLTGVSPSALGRLLGLDRAPEVKTLRRRVREIARLKKAGELMRELARDLVRQAPDELGFLYIDGHVRRYFGKRAVAKAYVTQMRISMPAATDFWVNDAHGAPLFVVTGEVVSALTRALLPILSEVRSLLGKGVRATVVFDRGGWSPKLFRKILNMGFDILTYRKGKCPRYPAAEFRTVRGSVDGREVEYSLRDGSVRAGKGLRLRSIVRLKDGHQTHVVTSRSDLPALDLAYRMFERWRQENYFKYADHEFDLDALDTYMVDDEDAERMVPNPARKRLDKAIRSLRGKLEELEAELGRRVDANAEVKRATVRGFKIAEADLRRRIDALRKRIEARKRERASYPEKVTVAQARGPEAEGEAVKPEVETKHFMNIVAMAVYRAETALHRLLEPHYRANDQEGRALLREAFRSSGSLHVDGKHLRVTLEPLSAPRRSEAIAKLCHHLNQDAVRIPGTSLRLEFAVKGVECSK